MSIFGKWTTEFHLGILFGWFVVGNWANRMCFAIYLSLKNKYSNYFYQFRSIWNNNENLKCCSRRPPKIECTARAPANCVNWTVKKPLFALQFYQRTYNFAACWWIHFKIWFNEPHAYTKCTKVDLVQLMKHVNRFDIYS